MLKNYLTLVLIAFLSFGTGASTVFAQRQADAEQIKAAVVKRGANEKKRVRVKMQNGAKIKGYISRIEDDSFTMTDSKTKQSVVVAYRDVTKVESGGLPGGARVGIIAGAIAGGAVLVFYIAFQNAIRDN